MPRTYLKDYIVATPKTIYFVQNDKGYDYYTTQLPDNSVDFDVYTRIDTQRQLEHDAEPSNRKFYKDNPRDNSEYINEFTDNAPHIYLYWNDWRGALYDTYTKTGALNIDLALNDIL